MKALFLAALIGSSIGPNTFTFHHENVMGTSCELRVAAATRADAELAESVALAEVDRLSKILSGYDPASEFSRWARTSGQPVAVSAELAEVLRLWDNWTAETTGALNPAVESASRLWRQGKVPEPAALAAAVSEMRGPHWKLEGRTATRLTPAKLMLNSFTKSWIMARAVDAALQTTPASGLTLNVGGDVVTRGALAELVALADPRNDAENAARAGTLSIRNLAVATSGDYRRGFDIDGKHYSHILDPRTARPADQIASATVVSPDAVEAGALATAFNVLSADESRSVAARHPRVEYLLIAANGNRIASKGWPALFAAAADTAKPAVDPANVQIEFDLARIDSGRYRRPFVAVWVEDKDKFPIRTIALWFDKPRWLPDLSAWSRGDRLRSMAEGTDITATVASATRPAGKYTLKWDGKDQAGKPVKPGKYTVYLEAAREHGGHTVLRQEIDLATAGMFPITGGEEIAAAKVEVRKTR